MKLIKKWINKQKTCQDESAELMSIDMLSKNRRVVLCLCILNVLEIKKICLRLNTPLKSLSFIPESDKLVIDDFCNSFSAGETASKLSSFVKLHERSIDCK